MQTKSKTASHSSEQYKTTDWIQLYFIYRHASFNKYITTNEFRHAFYVNKSNYEKTYAFFIKNIGFTQIPEPDAFPKRGSIKALSKKESENKVTQAVTPVKSNTKQNNIQMVKNIHQLSAAPNTPQKKQKKFICIGGYKDIVQGLVKRGWMQNKDPKSVDFDYIWTLRTCDINYSILKRDQLAGHFMKNGAITRKSGLSKNIRNLLYKNINPDNFFPRCYDLADKQDLNDFIEDFKTTKAMGILRMIISTKDNDDENTPEEINEEMVKVSIGIVERKMPVFMGEYNILGGPEIKLISDKEWNIISQEDNKGYIAYVDHFKRFDEIGFPQINIRSSSQLPKKLIALTNSNTIAVPTNSSQSNTGLITINKNPKNLSNNNIINNIQPINTKPQQNKTPKRELVKYIPIIQSLLDKLKRVPQYELNGEKNIWIMKPSCLSRGRGIVCTNKLNGILASIKESNQFIVQKYIENPMIILNRKFDIRQWVVITNINPLTIWMWDLPYLRFGAEDYSIENFSNLFAHLTNNSIGKHSDHFNDKKIEGNMWELHQFSQYLQKKYHRDVWPELKEKIIKIIITSFESARHEMKQRANSHELFGYDLMVDVNLNVYLIEVNSSPAVDYSTKITEKLVKIMSEDLLKVVIDNNSQIDKEKTIGQWKVIYTGNGSDINSSYTPN